MNKFSISIILGITCFALVVAIMIQTNTVKNSQTAIAKTTEEAELRDNILRYQERYDKIFEQLDSSNKKLDSLIEQVSNTSGGRNDYSEQLKNSNAILGYTDLEGPGIIITVEDGSLANAKGSAMACCVHDGDLYEIVNLLKHGKAEAISINEERIVANTAISCAGNVININGKKMGSPFVIKAIGLTEYLYGVTNEYLKDMQQQGVKVTVDRKQSKIFIKKYMGIQRFDYAK